MFYHSDFAIQSSKVGPISVQRNAFTVILQNNKGIKEEKSFSIAYALKPLFFYSSLFSMNSFIFTKCGINKVNVYNKLYSLIIISSYVTLVTFLTSTTWQQIKADKPLSILTKAFTVSQTVEIIYDIFINSFVNSIYYVTLIKILENIDEHFGKSNELYFKRRSISIIFTSILVVTLCIIFLLKKVHVENILELSIFIFVSLQGIISIYFLLLVYGQIVYLNIILLSKVCAMSSSKLMTFQDGLMKYVLRQLLLSIVNREEMIKNSYSWFEIMQIYDKISDCVYMFNKIYAVQILLMFNSWLLCTIVSICLIISPTSKNNDFDTADILYYFIFMTLRPFIVTKMSEYLKEEWQKMLRILLHILIYDNPYQEYYSQIATMIELMDSRRLQISANLCPVTITVFAAFTGRVISYTLIMIQNCYIRH